jgi:hypothetical protein
MPWRLQRILNFVPIKDFLLVLRGILLKGAGADISTTILFLPGRLGWQIQITDCSAMRRNEVPL